MTRARVNPTPDLYAFINESEALAENTKAGYRRAVDRWIGFVGPKLVDWTPANAMAFYKSLRADPKLSLKSANTIMWGVRYVMKRLTQMLGNAFPVNPIDTVERARVRAGRDDVTIVRALTPEEGRALYEACSGNDVIALRDRAIVLLSFVTGMRRSSLVATPAIATKVTPDVVFLNVPLKGGGFYNVPIHPAVWELTAAYRTALGSNVSRTSPLFRSFSQPTVSTGARVPGQQLTTDGLYKILGKRAVEAGIEDFHPHRCRHSFSTWCHMESIPTDRIEVVTGHKGNQSIARRVYGDDAMLAPQVVAAVWQAIGGVLGLV